MSNPTIVEASEKHTATIIFLHGLAETGEKWAELLLPCRLPNMKIICPNAPKIPITYRGGVEMTAWFDVLTLKTGGKEDEERVISSAKLVRKLIDEEIESGIPSHRIIVGGFSQGGALALHTAITYPKRLGGVLSLSAWVPIHQQVSENFVGSKDTPITMYHGIKDSLIPYKWSQMALVLLKSLFCKIQLKSYEEMNHTICEEELQDMKNFIEIIWKSGDGPCESQ